MQEHSLKKQVEILRPLVGQEDEAELAILYNALVTNINAYRSDSSAGALKNWQSAKSALADCLKHLHTKYGIKEEEAPAQAPEFTDTKNAAAVLRYLHANGWKVEKTQFYQHVKQGKLARNDQGLFTRRAVLRYAKDWVPRTDTGKTIGEEQEDLNRTKLQEEIKRIRVQQERDNFKFDVERGKYLPRADVEQELAGRAVALDAGYNHMVYSRVQEFIATVNGDSGKAPQLIESLLSARDDWFNQYASDMEFEVELAANMPAEEA